MSCETVLTSCLPRRETKPAFQICKTLSPSAMQYTDERTILRYIKSQRPDWGRRGPNLPCKLAPLKGLNSGKYHRVHVALGLSHSVSGSGIYNQDRLANSSDSVKKEQTVLLIIVAVIREVQSCSLVAESSLCNCRPRLYIVLR